MRDDSSVKLFRLKRARSLGGRLHLPLMPVGLRLRIAAKVLMNILYAVRPFRFDLLRALCYLATSVAKWTPECDRKLHRFVCGVCGAYIPPSISE